ncbi:hypothetical protein [Lihuaxuella thermophila]|uniref:Uncharacterized protein n=1 Tax=Lihuaxuella thermophila TaxID=1173111 RepID=A0A1H8FR68_9BACL|nr:hypothetical protein [Lihuaxuella thermophila]SEN34233.1 hypothetical protein SAMN05444955_10928 [Lihuaxuella thermophila]
MRVNLMPPIPAGRRFFSWWVSLIVLILSSLVIFGVWVYREQSRQTAGLGKQIAAYLPEESKIRAKVKEREEFTADHRAVLDYQKTVQNLRSENMDWDQALGLMESALPAEGRIFNVQVKGRKLEAMAAFSSLDGIAYFQDQMKKSASVKDFVIESVEEAGAVREVQIKPDTAKVIRFHFYFKNLASGVGGGKGGEK